MSGSGCGSEAVHQNVQQPACPGVVLGRAGHGEDTDEAGSDVFGGDIGAQLARRAAGIEDVADGREQFGLGLAWAISPDSIIASSVPSMPFFVAIQSPNRSIQRRSAAGGGS
jgi:hypothetical protein